MVVRGHVKWFDTTKGYGFVVSTDGEGDILLHSNVLRAFGFTSVAEGAEIVLQVQVTERGRQAVEVMDIVPAATNEGPVPIVVPETEAAGPLEPARVKWFDRVKGFGFVNIYGRPEDVFLHMETLRQYGYGEVVAGDVLAVRVTAGPRGPMVYEVRSWDYVVRMRMRTMRSADLAAALALAAGLASASLAAECAPDQVDLRDAGHDPALPRRGGGHGGRAGRGADAPRKPAEVLRHALRLRDAAAGGLLDAEHPHSARHAVLRCPGPADPHQEPGAAARRNPGRGRRGVQYVLEINGGLAAELGIDLGAELRHPALTGAAWSCAG